MPNFNESREKRHREREEQFGQRPFTFGRNEAGEEQEFYVRPNVGYIGIKRVAEINENTGGDETFDAVEASVISMIDPGQDGEALKRFLEVTRNPKDPVTFDDLLELQAWLLKEQTNLPPTEQQSSVASPTPNGTASTEVSSTELGEASTA